MTRHGRLGDVLVDPVSGRTTLDGEPLSVPPAEVVPLSRLYFL
jgi:urease subunit alpha